MDDVLRLTKMENKVDENVFDTKFLKVATFFFCFFDLPIILIFMQHHDKNFFSKEDCFRIFQHSSFHQLWNPKCMFTTASVPLFKL